MGSAMSTQMKTMTTPPPESVSNQYLSKEGHGPVRPSPVHDGLLTDQSVQDQYSLLCCGILIIMMESWPKDHSSEPSPPYLPVVAVFLPSLP